MSAARSGRPQVATPCGGTASCGRGVWPGSALRRDRSRHPSVRDMRRRRARPGCAAGDRRRRRRSPAAAAAAARRPAPSASISARRTTSCTSDCSRNRTSAFVGCTLTSTASGGISMNRCTSGLRSLIDADAVGVDDRVRDRPVLDDAPVDEDVLRPAGRTLFRQRRDVSGHAQCRRPPCATSRDRRARRTAETADRAAMPPAGTGAPCARRSSA